MSPVRWRHLGLFLRSLLAVGVAFGLLNWTEGQIGTVLMAFESLGLVIYSANARNGEA